MVLHLNSCHCMPAFWFWGMTLSWDNVTIMLSFPEIILLGGVPNHRYAIQLCKQAMAMSYAATYKQACVPTYPLRLVLVYLLSFFCTILS